MAVIDLLDTRVSPEGLSVLLACHNKLLKISHKETFHAFQLIQQQSHPTEEKIRLKHLTSTDVHLTPERFEHAIENCPYIQAVTIKSAGEILLERTYKHHYDYQNFSPLANGTDLN